MVRLIVYEIEVDYVRCFVVWGDVEVIVYIGCVSRGLYLNGEDVRGIFGMCVKFFFVCLIKMDGCGIFGEVYVIWVEIDY